MNDFFPVWITICFVNLFLVTNCLAQYSHIEKKERQTLKNGMEKEEDETNYRHRCSLCTKSYKSKYDLQKHVRGHTGEACYTCGQCSETFVNLFLVTNCLAQYSHMYDLLSG
jgi:hypothetical protein